LDPLASRRLAGLTSAGAFGYTTMLP
jgi:hypothetical protein